MKRKIIFIAFLTVLSGLSMLLYNKNNKRDQVTLIVFVHGTTGLTFNILNPLQCMNDRYCDDSWVTKISKKYRNHPLVSCDQVLEGEGLIPVEQCCDQKHAAYHIIPAYDEIGRYVNFFTGPRRYCTYGWSGLLSHQSRQEAACRFYKDLCAYRDALKKNQGLDLVIHIVAHSHGGNVALLLAEAEKKFKNNLSVELLCMLGTPIQIETAPYIESLFFKKIVSGYSSGDFVQGNDYFSTSKRVSYNRMSDLVDLKKFIIKNPGYNRCDMRFIVNKESNRISHSNMWLIGRCAPVLDIMDPLPLVILMPLFFSLIKNSLDCTHYEAHLHGQLTSCYVSLVSCLDNNNAIKHHSLCEKRLAEILLKWRNIMLNEWQQSNDLIRHPVFNAKNAKIVSDLFLQ